MPDNFDPDEIEALLQTRRELGPSYDRALVESFAERIEAAVEAKVGETQRAVQATANTRADVGKRQTVLAIVSVGAGIPITAISAAIVDLPGLITAWLGIVGVNVAHALQGRGR
ncbi:MAG: hypothetical protein H0V59_02610 [Nocardioidaceae bacterium]|nr:hypothetical protein [Nocardioidaceae bacterium]